MEPGTTLEYAPPRAPEWRRRLWWLGPLTVVAVIATVYVAAPWLVLTFERWQDLRRQKGLIEYRAPADRVVFERDGRKVDVLSAGGGEYILLEAPLREKTITMAMHLPEQWRSRPAGIAAMGGRDGLVFVHGRTSGGGNQRLVVIECDPAVYGTLLRLRLRAHSVRPGTWRQAATNALSSSVGTMTVSTTDFRILAGQPDGADLSHFTIDYQADRARGTIDGWLHDDDTITLKPRPLVPAPVSWDGR